ncbi:sugar (and other) transporter family protein [Paraburkholderia xenovorans LB400]|uniref:Major facilitator superfamily (MFS) transporter n=1 Tax=Paraburkholderia xenovorans (strain LB400) TaxID=266265 RepID=Q13I96_PARXL|nr:MFS transporter [Paraburkholderia xenovorans]ABE36193.1 major facilitator superfamily (MFS) transporter [Paraburkholderia xenovorans LB400]AIP34840.1 sugar (and other) transporter family protein [Paraburkholderia xenovorans LB400]
MLETRRSAAMRLDRLPIGRFHWRLLGLIGGGLFLDGFEVYVAGGVVGFLVKTGWANMHSAAMFVSASVAGMALGTWLAGVLGDRFGRRFTYQFNLLLFGLASFAAAVVSSMDQLIVARFVMGIGLGAEVVVSYGTLVEYIPPAHRGRWSSGLSLCGNAALFVAALVGYFVIPDLGWRWLFGGVGVAALIIWYMRKAVPESPRWLESQGRFEEADRILDDIEQELAYVGQPGEAAVPAYAVVPDLPRRMLVPRFIIGIMMSVAGNAAFYGLIVWLPTFFFRQGFTVGSSLGYSMVMSAGGPAGALVGMAIADRVRRKRAIIVLSIVAALLGLVYPLCKTPLSVLVTGFLLVSALYAFVAVAWASYLPELFPTRIRLRASAVCNVTGRLAAIAMPFAVVQLYAKFGVFGVVGALGGILLAQAAVIALLGIDTNNVSLEELTGQSAEEIGPAANQRFPSSRDGRLGSRSSQFGMSGIEDQ